MTQGSSRLPEARPAARLFRVWMAAAVVLAILPVLRSWQLTRDGDTAATTLALFAGAAWQMGELLPRVSQRPRPATRWAALGALGLVMWQLAWISSDDFWFFRVALLVWAAAWLALAWGVAGWVWGWRILAAFALWAWMCDSPWQWSRDGYQTGDSFGPALAVVTAKVAGLILALSGAAVQVSHEFLKLGPYTVSVGIPCTGLPLAKLLWLLLILAALLLRLSPMRTCWLALVAAAIAFVTSVGRVMVLAEVAGNQERFHYWHDPDRGGVGWFTAAGMLILAFLFARQYFAQHPVKPAATAEHSLPRPPDPRWLLAATVLVWLIAQLPLGLVQKDFKVAPAATNLLLESDLIQQLPSGGPLQPNAAVWTRRLQYTERSDGRPWTVLVASLPRTMEPDPRDQPGLDAALPALSGSWQPLASGGFSAPTSLAGSAWLTTVVPGQGALGADGAAWNVQQRLTRAGPRRWASWLLHRSPLRAKQTYWLAVWGPPTPNSAPPKLFFDWIALLRRAD